MPVKRRAGKLKFEFTFAHYVHLTTGTCSLAGPGRGCACGLTAEDGTFNLNFARELWRARRREILEAWNKSRDCDYYNRSDPLHGFGPYFCTYAEARLDGRPFPALDPTWPESVRRHHHYIEAALSDA